MVLYTYVNDSSYKPDFTFRYLLSEGQSHVKAVLQFGSNLENSFHADEPMLVLMAAEIEKALMAIRADLAAQAEVAK
jgi:hypothetical protein